MDNSPSRANSNFQLPSEQVDKRRYFFDIGYVYDITAGWDASVNYTTSASSVDGRSEKILDVIITKTAQRCLRPLCEAMSTPIWIFSSVPTMSKQHGVWSLSWSYRTVQSKCLYPNRLYVFSKQKIIGGVQWNKPEANSADYSTRAGFIQGLGENFWIKLLYSEAYRSPNFVETYLVAAALTRNPNLAPEHVKTYDLQFIYPNTKKLSRSHTVQHYAQRLG